MEKQVSRVLENLNQEEETVNDFIALLPNELTYTCHISLEVPNSSYQLGRIGTLR